MATAFVFPGQGSQTVGMGRALAQAFPAARQVFEEVDEALGEALSAVIWEGPLDRLTLTENAQPALMAASLAAMRVLEAEAGLDCRATRPMSRGIRSASIPRSRPPDRSALPTARGCYGFAAAPCRRRCRSGTARWPRCSGSSSMSPRRSPPKAPRGPCARRRTTTAPDRWWCPATRPRSNAPSSSPRRRARSARCCFRCPRRSIAR